MQCPKALKTKGFGLPTCFFLRAKKSTFSRKLQFSLEDE